MARPRNLCVLWCGMKGSTIVCGHLLCQWCVKKLRAIATDAGVPIDEELLGGAIRQGKGNDKRRVMTKAEKESSRRFAQARERREIEAARRTA